MADPLNILHVTPFFPPSRAYGGIPVVAGELCLELEKLGHRVTVFTTDIFDAVSRYRPEKETSPLNRLNIFRFPNLSNSLAYNMQCYIPAGMGKTASEILRGVDIIHLHGHRHFLNNIVRKYALKYEVPYILTGHGTVPAIERRLLLKRIFDLMFGKKVIKDASGFIAVSDAEHRQMTDAGIPAEKIRVIHNGIQTARFASLPDKGTFGNMFDVRGDYILYLGKITPRKGVGHLVRAFSEMKDRNLKLVIAGNFMGSRKEIENIIDEKGLRERVVMTGLLSEEETLAAYRDALATVYPSTLEIFGLVPFESIMCGTPVIVSDDCGCGGIIRSAGAGYTVPYGDVLALVKAITKVIDDPGKAERMVFAGQEFIKANLNWKNIASQTAGFYRDMIAK